MASLETNNFNPAPIKNEDKSLGLVSGKAADVKIKIIKPPIRIIVKEVANGWLIETHGEFSESSFIARTKDEALAIAKKLMEE